VKFVVTIRRREGIADPEGVATTRALLDLGYTEVSDVHFGRIIVVAVDAEDEAAAQARVVEMCERLLANPVIEDYSVEAVP
jgi:phosphoribosylformylglycinamidine synthase